jgi:hypothetical protein
MANCCLLSRLSLPWLRRCVRPAGPSDPGSRPILDPTSRIPEGTPATSFSASVADDTNTQDNCHRMVEPIRRPVHSRPPSFGARFLLYQRNSENLSKDRGVWARRSGSRWPSFSTRLWSPARRSRSRVRLTSTPRGQPSHGMRTVSTARSRDVPAMHHHGTSGSRAAPVTLYLPGRQSQTHWSGAVRRIGFLVQSPLGHPGQRPFFSYRIESLA